MTTIESLLPNLALTTISSNQTLAAPAVNTDYINGGSGALTVTPVAGSGPFTLREGTFDLSVPLPTENLLLHSAALTDAYWSASLATITDNAATDPLGASTASSAVMTASNNAVIQRTAATLTAGQQYTMSLWVKGVGTSIGCTITLGNFNNGPFQYSLITLTADWQLVTVTFTPAGTSGNNLFLQFSSATLTHFGNVPSGATVYLWGWQLNLGPYKKNYAVTTTSVVNDTSGYQVLGVNTTSAANPIVDFIEETSGVFVGTPRAITTPTPDPTFLLIKNGARRQATIVIAASDSVNPYASDYICTGSADQTPISNAIYSLRGHGGKVLLRAGTYGLSAAIMHDADWVTLEGEARGFWGRYIVAYPTISSQGYPGGVKIKQLTSGADAIDIGTNYQADTRHRGIGIKNLYLYGYQLTGTGISDASNTDISEITDCVFHNFVNGINIAWDTPFISGNSVQSCSGYGITSSFVYGTIVKNIFYDIGGSGIILSGSGVQAVGNTVGHTGAAGISSTGAFNTITGNTVQGPTAGSCIDLSGAKNNAIVGNTISMNRLGSETNSNTAGHGIYLHATSIGNSINGNTIANTNSSSTGYAVCLGQAGDTTVTGNSVVGNAISGSKWNGASATTILDSSGGSTNKISLNAGDSH